MNEKEGVLRLQASGRDVALAKHKGCIIEEIRRKPTIYYWRKGRIRAATTFGSAGEAARDFLGNYRHRKSQ